MRGDETCPTSNRYRSPSGAWHLHAVEYADSASGRFGFDRALGQLLFARKRYCPGVMPTTVLKSWIKVRLVAVAADQGGVQ